MNVFWSRGYLYQKSAKTVSLGNQVQESPIQYSNPVRMDSMLPSLNQAAPFSEERGIPTHN